MNKRLWKEGNVLFNDAFNTFYLRLYGDRHMAMDIQVARDENRCRHMGYSLQLAARVLLCPLSHRLDSTYHGFFFTPVVEHWLEREIAQWFHHEESIRRPIAP